MSINTITTICHPSKRYREDGSSWEYRDSRTVGYLNDFDEAERLLTENCMDLNEAGYYPYAVIECFPEGIYPFYDDYGQVWYEWNEEVKRYEKLDETPEEFRQTVGFGMG